MTRFAPALLLLAAFTQGCSHHPRRHAARDADPLSQARPAAAALVFEPSVTTDLPPDALARDDREPHAFVGYPEGVTEYFYLRWDDRQSNRGHGRHGGDDRYERRAVSEKVGVLYR